MPSECNECWKVYIPKLTKLHLAPKKSHQKILGRKQMGKEVRPRVSSDWRCEVRIIYLGVCLLSCVKTHIHKTCHLKNFSVHLSIVKYILTVMQLMSRTPLPLAKVQLCTH